MLRIDQETSKEGFNRLRLVGRLDTNTTPQLEQVLETAAGSNDRGILFDLSELEYISSAGLRAIFRAKRAAAESGANVYVFNLQPQVQKVFDIVKAMPTESIFSSWEELDAYLDKMQKRVLEGDD